MILLDYEKILYDYAVSLVGTPYLWGGDNALEGFDCSGYVSELLRSVGLVHGKQGSQALFELFKATPAKDNFPVFGCLAFYGKPSISHVAFCLNSKLMIEAASGDSTTINRQVAEKQGACVKVRLINYRNDLVSILKPKYPWEI